MPQFLTIDDVLESHAEQIAAYGGTDGVRDIGLLQSALAQPEATFGGQFLHADVFEMAAAYLFHIVQNHPFVDGNKRVGLEAALLFLQINGLSVETTDDALVDLVLQTNSTGASDQTADRGVLPNACGSALTDLPGLLAREVFVTLNDHVRIQRVEFHEERLPPGLLRGHERRATAAE